MSTGVERDRFPESDDVPRDDPMVAAACVGVALAMSAAIALALVAR